MSLKIGNKNFDDKNRVYIMGILNLTPDSFFDGGKFNNEKLALDQAEKMIIQGADLIDIGAESTRPGHKPISAEEEIFRLGYVVTALKKRFNIPVSVDTTKVKVAEYVLNQGADLINDVSNLSDKVIADVVAKYDAVYCLTFNVNKKSDLNFLDNLKFNYKEKLDELLKRGVSKSKIMFDPGIGFNKTFEENLFILKHIDEITALGLPVLVGTSNKSFIGKILNNQDVNFRKIGTAVTSAILALHNVNFIRVHDIKANLEAVKVACAIKNC